MRFIFILLLGLCLSSAAADKKKPKEKTYVIIDVRTLEEWNKGHHSEAVHIPYTKIADKVASVTKDKNKKIYLYCAAGRRAQVALIRLKFLGYKNLKNLGSLSDAKKAIPEKKK